MVEPPSFIFRVLTVKLVGVPKLMELYTIFVNSGAAIAGVVLGSVLIIMLIVLTIFIICKKR